ncbi:MAG TPA: HD domain-containing protein [Methanoregulaceae archaeon]|nr:HD domain-containing protein [Methanoregulaceae archaeon]
MKSIKDPVHGYVEVDKSIIPILDSAPVQRLRYIRQLGFSYLVYPGANHTRFEHSLGTMHLAGMMSRQLGISAEENRLIMVAAVLHDIGHGPFSHSIEPVMEEFTGRSHHEVYDRLDDPALGPVIGESSVDTGELKDVLKGMHRLSGIIYGDLDVDRMDYLRRDAHYTGVPYGTVDSDRLVRSTLLTEDGIVIDEGGINAAESLLIARTLMRPAVYYHHVSRIAETMFDIAVFEHLHNKPRHIIDQMLVMDDASCMHALRTSDNSVTSSLVNRIYYRKLFKRALYVGSEQVNAKSLSEYRSIRSRKKLAEEIAEETGADPSEVLVDIPALPTGMSLRVQVKNRHRVVDLGEVSPLLNSLNENRLEQWRLGVYCPRKLTEEVGNAAMEVLHVRPLTKQDKLPL